MNYIVISPYYPKNFQQFTIELRKKGINVLGIGQEPYEQLDLPLREALGEYFRVNNLEDVEEVKRAVAFLFHKHGPIDRIESHNEHWLELDAALRTQFNVFGAKTDDLKKTKLKSEMKKYFQKAGIPVAPGYLVQTHADIPKAIDALGLPVIAKPDNGVGALKTFKLVTPADVEQFKQDWQAGVDYFFESFVNCPVVCTYDGLIDANGQVAWETSLTYYYAPLDLMLYNLDITYYIEKEIEPKLQAYGRKIIDTFGMKERFFHIEFFKQDNGDYIAIEYNNRPAGGFAIDVYNYAHSIDLYSDYANLVAGNGVPERLYKPQYALAVTRRDTTPYIHSHDEIINKYAKQLRVKLRMPDEFAVLQGNDMYVLTSDDFTTIDDIVKFVRKRTDKTFD